ncbi:unnamed protein product [Closterium sp. NIES-65]|nr:unnamed protein product [Closterium sp. NIES-65]
MRRRHYSYASMAGDSRLTKPRGSSSNPQAARNASHTAQNAAPNPTATAELPLPSFHVDVAIAGGGLAGLALAAGLQARGIEAAVFEAAPAARRSNNSTGTVLGVYPNGFNALEGLKPGLGEAVIASGSPVAKITFVARQIPADIADSESAIQEVLASSLTRPEIIMHGHRVVAYHPVVAGKPVASSSVSDTTKDGADEGEVEAVDVVLEVVGSNLRTGANISSVAAPEGADIGEEGGAAQQQRELVVVRAKILVAADGVRSAVRNQMIGDSPRYLEQFGWNARVPSQPSGDVSQQQNRTVLSFKDAVTGYQMFLIDGGKTFWHVSAADPDGQLKAELEQTPFGGFGKPGVKDRLMCHVSKHIADPSAHDTWHTVLQAVTTTDPGNIYERWMMDRPPPKDSWSDSKCGNRVVLMGDAAHAMHPELGQGAQTAFEDAHQLSLCLAEIKDVLAEPAAVAAAVREYEGRRIDRCVRIHAYATAAHGFGEEARLVRELSPPEKSKLFMEFQKWILAYPDKIKGDPESTYFK